VITTESLLSPLGVHAFLETEWQRRCWKQTGEHGRFSGLLTQKDIERIVCDVGPLAPEQSALVKEGESCPRSTFCFPSGRCVPSKVFEQFEDGATLILPMLHLLLAPLRDTCRDLERELAVRAQANVYLTPSNASGFVAHYDSHDAVVAQVSGTKRWQIFDEEPELPMSDQRFHPEVQEVGEVIDEFELSDGDVLYIPRGVVHRAAAAEHASLHVTFGLFGAPLVEVVIAALGEIAASDALLRRTFAAEHNRGRGGGVSVLGDRIRALFAEQLTDERLAGTLDAHFDDLAATRMICRDDALLRVRQAQTLAEGATLKRSALLLCSVRERGADALVIGNGIEVELPLAQADEARSLLQGPPCRLKGAEQVELANAGRLTGGWAGSWTMAPSRPPPAPAVAPPGVAESETMSAATSPLRTPGPSARSPPRQPSAPCRSPGSATPAAARQPCRHRAR
jgi:ribosomal protein L16 Arg81 hydroxylase